MILWTLLTLSLLSGAFALGTAQANARVAADMRESMKRHGLRGVPLGCAHATISAAVIACWIAYAIQVGDWRFAAIPGVTFALNAVANYAKNALAKQITTEETAR